MNRQLPASLLAEFGDFVTREIGLYYPPERLLDLQRGILAAAKELEFDDAESCIHWLMTGPISQKQIEILASHLTIGETYFFRIPEHFQILERNIIPALIAKRCQEKQLQMRIWSAGCASGEEPYSIAILLHKMISNLNDWKITLLASDINTRLLKKLSSGIYTEWSFHGTEDEIKRKYFRKTEDGRYEIHPQIRRIVEPFYLNLICDNYPSLLNNTNAMDIILCRNVLMYFSPELAINVVHKLYDCLVDGGYLIVSPGEVPQPYFSEFAAEEINGLTVYRRKNISGVIFPHLAEKHARAGTMAEEKPETLVPDSKMMTRECANKGRFNEALAWNDKALSANKFDPDLHYMRAEILLELQRVDEALASLNLVLYIDSKHALTYIMLANISRSRNAFADADRHFEYALKLLKEKNPDEMMGEITVGRLIEIIHSMRETG